MRIVGYHIGNVIASVTEKCFLPGDTIAILFYPHCKRGQ